MATPKKNDTASNAGPAGAAAGAAELQLQAPVTSTAAVTRYVIEDNIPIPERKVGGKGESAYPFRDMQVNQSFFVPASDRIKEPWKTLTSMTSRMSREMFPKQFTTARVTVGEQEGVRIWRTADAVGEQKPPRKLNKRAKPAGEQTEAQRLAAEAVAGDTSIKAQPVPDFVDAGSPPPPPPPPAA